MDIYNNLKREHFYEKRIRKHGKTKESFKG